jgi:PAS domain S-box-containing protein
LRRAVATKAPVLHRDTRGGRLLESRMHPILDAAGNVVRVAVYSTDVTERTLAQQALRDKQRDYATLVEAAGETICTVGADGRVALINHSGAAAAGSTPEQLEGARLEAALPGESAQPLRAAVRRVLAGGPAESVEYVAQTPAGPCWHRAQVQPLVDDRQSALALIISRDIDYRKQMEHRLQEAHDRLQQVVDNTWDIIFQCDLEGNYTFVNKAGQRVTGYTSAQLLRMNMRDLTLPEFLPKLIQRIKDRIAGRPLEQPAVFAIRSASGNQIWIEMTTTPIYRDGKLVAVQGVSRDITRRRTAEQALQQAHIAVVSAREEERRRVAGELHDSVGQSLVALQIGIQNLLAQPQAAPAAPALQKTTGRLEAVIREVRNICRGLYPPALSSMGLPAALRQMTADLADSASVSFRCDRRLKQLRLGDGLEISLFRIAQESLANALRHGRATKVGVTLRKCGERCVRLTVADNGRGFDPDRAAVGMGLSTMRQRAAAAGGELTVKSRPGRTTISCRIPLPDIL